MSSVRLPLWLWILLSASIISSIVAWDIDLLINTQISTAFGGLPFSIQPVLVVNNLKGELQSTFEGRVTAHTLHNEKHASVWKEGGGLVSQDVVNGHVFFEGLGIDETGEYQLEFVLYDEFNLVLGTTIGNLFSVEVGERYKLDIVTQPEVAYGGGVFGSQPVLVILDRGGNVLSDVNEGTVRWFAKDERRV